MANFRFIYATICLLTALQIQAEEQDSLTTTQMNEVEIISPLKENGQTRMQSAAVSLIDTKQIRNNRVVSLKRTSTLVPNLFIPDYGSRLTSAIYIRGIGSRINTPAVGLYVDDVPYLDKSAFDFNLMDIERIDVLRGPQGTMYGRNTMGGLVRVYTKNPFYHHGTDVRLSYATGDNHRTASVTHNHRVNDQLAFSVGGYSDGSNGFFENDFTGKRSDAMESGGGRVRAIYKPTDKLNIDANVNYDYSDEGAYPYYYLGTISNNRESNYRRSLLNASVNVAYQQQKWQMNAITGYQHIRDRMFMDQDFTKDDIYTLEQKQRIHTLTEEIVFKNKGNQRWQWISGGNVFYQALHTDGPVIFYEDGLRWLEKNINSVMPDMSQIPMMQKMGFQSMEVTFRGDELLMDGNYETPTLGAALFHQSTLSLNDHWKATAGIRLDYEHQQMQYHAPAQVPYAFALNNASPMMAVKLQQMEADIAYEGKLKNDRMRVLPKLSLQYDIDSQNNVYASASMGQRSGGYNLQMFSDLLQGSMRVNMMEGIKNGVGEYLQQLVAKVPQMPQTIPAMVRDIMDQNMPKYETPTVDQVVYKPEYSLNYEVGSHLTQAEGKLAMDAALFYSQIYDQQIARFAPTGLGRMMVNAGKSESWGGELSLRYTPTRQLMLVGNYGYTHATFLKYDNGNGQDYQGNFVPFVPQHTMSMDAAYTWKLGNNSLTLGMGCHGAGRIQWTEANTVSEPFRAQLNARLSFQTKYFTASLWSRNITDTRYNTFYFESDNRGYEQHGKPRQFGLDLDIHF